MVIKTMEIGTNRVAIDQVDSKYYVTLTGNFNREIRIVCSTEARANRSFDDVVKMLIDDTEYVPYSGIRPITDSLQVVVTTEEGDSLFEVNANARYRGVLDLEQGILTQFE